MLFYKHRISFALLIRADNRLIDANELTELSLCKPHFNSPETYLISKVHFESPLAFELHISYICASYMSTAFFIKKVFIFVFACDTI